MLTRRLQSSLLLEQVNESQQGKATKTSETLHSVGDLQLYPCALHPSRTYWYVLPSSCPSYFLLSLAASHISNIPGPRNLFGVAMAILGSVLIVLYAPSSDKQLTMEVFPPSACCSELTLLFSSCTITIPSSPFPLPPPPLLSPLPGSHRVHERQWLCLLCYFHLHRNLDPLPTSGQHQEVRPVTLPYSFACSLSRSCPCLALILLTPSLFLPLLASPMFLFLFSSIRSTTFFS